MLRALSLACPVDVADELRRSLMRVAVSVEPLRARLIDRAARIRLFAFIAIVLSAATALRFPFVSLWCGAALFGVPHVLAGIRHQAVVRSLALGTRIAAVAGCALGAAAAAGAPTWLWTGMPFLFGAAIAAQALAVPGRWARALGVALAVAATALFLLRPRAATLFALHAHAWGSLAYFVWAAHRRGVALRGTLVAVALIAMAAMSGMLDGLFPAAPFVPRSAAGSLLGTLQQLAPVGTRDVVLRRLLFLFAWGQSLHYLVWLRLMPEVDRPAPVPQTFRRAFEALQRDFGRWAIPALALCGLAPVAIFLGGSYGREAYFAVAYFHMAMEAAAFLAARPPG